MVCEPATANLKIAALTVLDRMVVATHRAGCAPILLLGEGSPPLERAEALGIKTTFVREPPTGSAPALLISGSVLIEPADIRRVIEADGRLLDGNGSSLPVQMNSEQSQPIRALGVAERINDEASARRAEGKLWGSLGSTADGVIDRYFNRPVGRLLSKILIHTSVSPNLVSIISILIGVAAAPYFARGDFIIGALLLQLCAIVDCVDGDLARVLFKQSALGKWIDLGGDQIVHFAIFAAIGIGVARTHPDIPAVMLGASAAIGVLICFPILVGALRQPVAQRHPFLRKLIDVAGNRDFSVLLLALALVGRMDLFLWMAAFGIHVFWFVLLVLQRRPVG